MPPKRRKTAGANAAGEGKEPADALRAAQSLELPAKGASTLELSGEPDDKASQKSVKRPRGGSVKGQNRKQAEATNPAKSTAAAKASEKKKANTK